MSVHPNGSTRVHFSLHNYLTSQRQTRPADSRATARLRVGRPRCSVVGSTCSALQFWGETQRQEAARRVASSTAAAASKSWGAARTTASSSPTRPAAPPSRPHSRPSLEPGVAARSVASLYSSSARKQNSHRQPDSRMSMCRPRPRTSTHADPVRRAGPREGSCGSRPPRRQSLRMPGLPLPVPLVTVGNTSLELAFWGRGREAAIYPYYLF